MTFADSGRAVPNMLQTIFLENLPSVHTWKKEQQQYGAVWSEHKSCKSAILFLNDGFFCWQPQIGIVFRYANPPNDPTSSPACLAMDS